MVRPQTRPQTSVITNPFGDATFRSPVAPGQNLFSSLTAQAQQRAQDTKDIQKDFLAGQVQVPGMNIAPSFSNVFNPSQTAYGGSIQIGVPTDGMGAIAPSGTTGGSATDYMPIVYLVIIMAVVLFAVYMFQKRKK